jgi:hypothetical protein
VAEGCTSGLGIAILILMHPARVVARPLEDQRAADHHT